MAATREQIMVALLALIETSGSFVTVSRRNRDPEGMEPEITPALFLLETDDKWDRGQGYNIGPKRSMSVAAIIYIDVGPDKNAIPGTFINNTLEAIDGLFKPDDPQRNAFTLGGLVQSCALDGETKRASGDVTGKGLAVVPIRILMP